MSVGNAVQLLVLVLTSTTICQVYGDGDISVSCENVTGTVSEEVTLTCSVSLKKSGCCFTGYKFQYPVKYNDSTICREEFPQDSCEQRNSFTCSFTSTTVMTGEFRFFVRTKCGNKITEFTVDITETSKPEPVTEDPDDISVSCENVTGTVSEEVTLTCSVSLKNSLKKEEFPQDSCEQRNNFTCSFSPTTVMTGEFRFFVQTNCGNKRTEFTVDITETSKPEPVTEDPGGDVDKGLAQSGVFVMAEKTVPRRPVNQNLTLKILVMDLQPLSSLVLL
ncbi:unnamed protein product [Leuciscus chuanchicus]